MQTAERWPSTIRGTIAILKMTFTTSGRCTMITSPSPVSDGSIRIGICTGSNGTAAQYTGGIGGGSGEAGACCCLKLTYNLNPNQ